MSIEIYDKATIVKKNNTYYYFLKNGSKNCFTCAYQTIVDNNFNNKFIKRQTRDSDWSIIAIGDKNDVKNNKIAETKYNCPTSHMYGKIKFGNKLNIALYFVKNKNKILDYNLLNEMQQANIDNSINYYIDELDMKYTINLKVMEEKDKLKELEDYCENSFNINNNSILYNGLQFWNLDNL